MYQGRLALPTRSLAQARTHERTRVHAGAHSRTTTRTCVRADFLCAFVLCPVRPCAQGWDDLTAFVAPGWPVELGGWV